MRFHAWGALLIVGIVGGCQGGFSKTRKEHEKTTLTLAKLANFSTFDPHHIGDVNTGDLMRQVYEPLFRNGEGNRVVPVLVEKSTFSKDYRSLTLKIRRDSVFSNGDPLTAKDVAFSLQRILQPRIAMPWNETQYQGLVGMHDFILGKYKSIPGIKLIDEATVRLDFDSPKPQYELNLIDFPVVNSKVAPKEKPMETLQQSVGSGPYMFESFKTTQEATFIPNPHYRGGPPPFEKIRAVVLLDSATRMTAFRQGTLDLATYSSADASAVAKDSSLNKYSRLVDIPQITYIDFKPTKIPALKDERVRRALSLAIDRDFLAREVLEDSAAPLHGLVPRTLSPDFPPTPKLGDSQQAKKLMAEAGYPRGKGFPSLKIFCYSYATKGAEAVATMWSKTLGIDCRTQPLEIQAMIERANAGQLEIAIDGWVGANADAVCFLPPLFRSSSSNVFWYKDPAVDRALDEATAEPDETKRNQLYAKAERILLDRVAVIPLFSSRVRELNRTDTEYTQLKPWGYPTYFPVTEDAAP